MLLSLLMLALPAALGGSLPFAIAPPHAHTVAPPLALVLPPDSLAEVRQLSIHAR